MRDLDEMQRLRDERARDTYNLATYNLQVFGPLQNTHERVAIEKRMLSNLPAMLEAVEEDLTKLLPPGYEARIREWSSNE